MPSSPHLLWTIFSPAVLTVAILEMPQNTSKDGSHLIMTYFSVSSLFFEAKIFQPLPPLPSFKPGLMALIWSVKLGQYVLPSIILSLSSIYTVSFSDHSISYTHTHYSVSHLWGHAQHSRGIQKERMGKQKEEGKQKEKVKLTPSLVAEKVTM